MSYILEALKKSDRERKQGEVPDLQSVHGHRSGHAKGERRFSLWMWLLVGGVLGLSALALYWGTQRNKLALEEKISALEESVVQLKEQPVTMVVPPAALHEEIAPPAAEVEAGDDPALVQPPAPAAEAGAKPFVMAIEADTGLEPKHVQAPVPAEKTVIRPEDLPPKAAPEDGAETAENLPLLKDLPPSVQKSLPQLKLAGHVYSKDGARRMIIINNRICREGDLVENQLYLEQILWEGVVLRYQELRFRMNIL